MRDNQTGLLPLTEEAHQALLEFSPTPVWINHDNRIIFVNDAGLRLLGAGSREQVLGRSPLEFIHPRYHALVQSRITKIIEGGDLQVEPLEEDLVRLDGTLVPAAVTAAVFPYRGSRAVQVHFVDLTPFKRTEATLAQSEAELNLIANHLPALVAYLDTKGRYVRVNNTYARWFGLPPEQIVGRRVEDVVRETVGERYWQMIRGALAQALAGEAVMVEAEGQYPGGQRAVQVHYTPDIDKGGELRGVVVLIVDMSRQKALDDELKLRANLLDEAMEPVFAWELGGAITYWNRAAEELYGYTREEAVGRVSHALLHTQHPIPTEELERLLRQVGHWEGELVHFDKSGKEVVVDSRHRVVEQRDRLVVLESNRDITSKRQAAEMANRLAAIVASSDDAIIGKSLDGIITDWNQAAERLFGYTAMEAIGRPVTILHPPEQEDVLVILDRIRQGERVEQYETIRQRKDGSRIVVALTVSPIRDSKGRVVGASKIARDITARKQVETALRESERRFRELADAMPQIVWSAEPGGRFDYYNERWHAFTGFPRGSIHQRDWTLVLHSDDLPACRQKWADAVRTGNPYEMEFRLKDRVRGTHRWHLGRAFPIRDDCGTVRKWYGTCTDIDDLKRAEDDIRHLNEELERRVEQRTGQLAEANRELEAFAYSVSHDLRAPLRAVEGFGRILLRDYADRFDSTSRNYLERMSAATVRMGQLIEALLNLSRLSRTAIRDQEVDLAAMAREVLQELAAKEPERQVRVTVAQSLLARGDARLLRVVLDNLIGNAWKFTSKTANAEIEVGAQAEDGGTVYFVRDNGAGFDMAFSNQLFAPFQRLHRATEFEGTGIGLATVQRIIHRHGGKVWAVSAPGNGTTFFFRLQ